MSTQPVLRPRLDFPLHPKQLIAYNSQATEILYGGAAGGAKSHLMRVCAVSWCMNVPGLQVYLFRRIRDDLVKNHIEGPKGLRAMLGGFVKLGLVTIIEDEIKFWNGSKIYLCHCKDEKDRWKYLGAEIHVLLMDELTSFSDIIYRFLRGRVRAVGLAVPDSFPKGFFPRILCGSNPGGVGHLWVKNTFIDNVVPLEMHRAPDSEGGMMRQFIPSRLEDNPSMTQDDPGYRQRLRGLGSPALVKAMEEGDWNVIAGAFFPEFSTERHVIEPFEIPAHWMRYRALDWGSARPFSVGWYAVADGDTRLPRGALVKYREWYGWNGTPNIGIKLTAEQLAHGILNREVYGETPSCFADPSIFSQDGGPSIAERMALCGVSCLPADNQRIAKLGTPGGWDQLRARLVGDEDGRPLLYFFASCVHTIRTLPALQHDELRLEDLDTESEDHAADETRYACMSRPWIRNAPKKPEPPRGPRTFAEMISRHEAREYNHGLRERIH